MFKANQIIEAIQALGYGKDLNTGLNRWLRTMTGRVGSTNTLWFNYLRGLGYTGSLNTMLAAYYAASNGAAITNPIPSLFRNNEKGVWYDPSDLTSMFQDSTGTTAAVVGQPVGKILDKSGNGYHATQVTSTARPILARHPIGGRRNVDYPSYGSTNHATGSIFGIAVYPTIVTGVAGAPDGSSDATRLTWGGVQARFGIAVTATSQMIPDQNGFASASIYMRSVSGTVNNVSLQIRSSITANTVSTTPVLTTEWQRVSLSRATVAGQGLTGWYLDSSGNSAIEVFGYQLEASATPTAYQKATSTYDVTEAGVNDAYLFDGDGVDDAVTLADSGGGTTGFFLCAAVRPDGGASAVRTIWSDAGTNTGYIVRLNASNQLEIAAGNGTAYTLAATTDTLTVGTTYVVTAWDDGTNLNVQVNSGTAGTAARPVVSAGTTTATIGKDNGASTGFFNGAIYPLVYVKNGENVDAADRTAVKSFVASKAGVTL